ncbi:MAG: hypothetical protein AAB372_00365 [Patescibacteria group bacterium]
MGIDDLQKRLFRKNERFDRRYEEPQLDKHRADVSGAWSHEQEHEYQEAQPPEDMREKRISRSIIRWGIGGGVVMLLGIFGYLFWTAGGFNLFKPGHDTLQNISISVEGGEEIVAGRKVAWRVTYKNGNKTPLENAVLVFEFPNGTQPVVGEFSKTGLKREKRELQTLGPEAVSEEIFQGIVFGPKDSIVGGRVSLEYRPQDSSARFSKDVTYESKIYATSLGIQFDIPQGLQGGQQAEIKLHVTSSAENVFRGMYVMVEYPDSFEYADASPAPEQGNNVWKIGDLPASGEFIVTLRGKIKPSENPETFHARVGLYDRAQDSWIAFNTVSETYAVNSSLLSVAVGLSQGEQEPGVVTAGDELRGTVRWRNNLPVAVHNVEVEVVLDGKALDLRRLSSTLGEYDQSRNALRWVPGRVPALSVVEPGASGEFDFGILLLKDIPITSPSDKDFVITLKSRIHTTEVPSGYQGVDLSGVFEKAYKVATRARFVQNGYYFGQSIQNTGPLPPRVGLETTYTVVWSIANAYSDLKNVEVKATLPSYVSWKNVVVPSQERLQYKQTTGELVWLPGTIPAGTGYVNQPREVTFQIGIKPSLPQVDSTPQLISAASFRAEDSFTGRLFLQPTNQINTDIGNDPEAVVNGAAVRE